MGVAKNLFSTRLCRRLNNKNEEANTPAINNENPNWPGKIKSICLYARPGIFVIVTVPTVGFLGNILSFILLTDSLITDCNKNILSDAELEVVSKIFECGKMPPMSCVFILSIAVICPFCNASCIASADIFVLVSMIFSDVIVL